VLAYIRNASVGVNSNTSAEIRYHAVDMALCKPADAFAPITRMGVALTDDSMDFWTTFGSKLSEEPRRAALAVGEELRDEWGCITVGCFPEALMLHDLENVIRKNGGNVKWVRAIEHLLGCTFKRQSTGVPESAALVRMPLAQISQNVPRDTEKRLPMTDPSNRLGAALTRSGELESLRLDKAEVLKQIVESKDLSRRLTFNDSRAVSHLCWKRTAHRYQNYGNCKILFKHLHKQLLDIGVPHPNKGDWVSVFSNRWELCRKSKTARLALGSNTRIALTSCAMTSYDARCAGYCARRRRTADD
jgi:hypothetical protein